MMTLFMGRAFVVGHFADTFVQSNAGASSSTPIVTLKISANSNGRPTEARQR